jgi:hypothetical protein
MTKVDIQNISKLIFQSAEAAHDGTGREKREANSGK